MEKLNFANYNFQKTGNKEKKNENFGKVQGRNYNKPNRLPDMKNAMVKNASAKMEGPLRIGQAVYNTEMVLKNFFDEELLKEIKIQSYKNRKIYLSVSNSLIAQELKFEKEGILAELKSKFPVNDLVILAKARGREDYD